MSVEDRLFALAQQCRQQNGDVFLAAATQLVPRLNSQAPDLHAEIRALAAAFEFGAAARIAGAPDAAAETAKLASEIAVRERLSLACVNPALAVARRLGPLRTGAAPAAPTQGGWAGDSVIVGAGAAQAQTPPAPQAPSLNQGWQTPPAPQAPAPNQGWQTPGVSPQLQSQREKFNAFAKKNPLVIGAIALVGLYMAYQGVTQMSQSAQQQQPSLPGQQQPMLPGQQPQQPMMPGQQPQPMQPQQSSMPLLQPMGAATPTLPVQRNPQTGAPVFTFAVSTPRGPAPGMVMLPAGGWQSGPAGFLLGVPGDSSGQNVGAAGQGIFELGHASNGAPARIAQVQLTQDTLGTGGVCLMFIGQQGQQDVQLSGTDFCLMNSSCSQPVGCGKLQ